MSSPAPSLNPYMASGLMLALLGAIAFSGKAIIVKLAYRHGVDAVTLIMYRMVLALPYPDAAAERRTYVDFGRGDCAAGASALRSTAPLRPTMSPAPRVPSHTPERVLSSGAAM